MSTTTSATGADQSSDSAVIARAMELGIPIESGKTTVAELRAQIAATEQPTQPAQPQATGVQAQPPAAEHPILATTSPYGQYYVKPIAAPVSTIDASSLEKLDKYQSQREQAVQVYQSIQAQQQQIDAAKAQLKEAEARGDVDPIVLGGFRGQIADAQTELNTYVSKVYTPFVQDLSSAQLYYKTYGGTTDVGAARLETPEFAAVYAAALKERGVSATAVEKSGLPSEVKKQFASLGGFTPAGEAHQAQLAADEYSRTGGMTPEGAARYDKTSPTFSQQATDAFASSLHERGYTSVSVMLSDLPESVKESYQKQYGGLTEVGAKWATSTEGQKVIQQSDFARGFDKAQAALARGEAIPPLKSEEELRGATYALAERGGLTPAGSEQIQRDMEKDPGKYAEMYRNRGYDAFDIARSDLPKQVKQAYQTIYGGPTEAGVGILGSAAYIETVTKPAEVQRGYEKMRSAILQGTGVEFTTPSEITGAEKYLGEIGGPTLYGLQVLGEPEYREKVTKPALEARVKDVEHGLALEQKRTTERQIETLKAAGWEVEVTGKDVFGGEEVITGYKAVKPAKEVAAKPRTVYEEELSKYAAGEPTQRLPRRVTTALVTPEAVPAPEVSWTEQAIKVVEARPELGVGTKAAIGSGLFVFGMIESAAGFIDWGIGKATGRKELEQWGAAHQTPDPVMTAIFMDTAGTDFFTSMEPTHLGYTAAGVVIDAFIAKDLGMAIAKGVPRAVGAARVRLADWMTTTALREEEEFLAKLTPSERLSYQASKAAEKAALDSAVKIDTRGVKGLEFSGAKMEAWQKRTPEPVFKDITTVKETTVLPGEKIRDPLLAAAKKFEEAPVKLAEVSVKEAVTDKITGAASTLSKRLQFELNLQGIPRPKVSLPDVGREISESGIGKAYRKVKFETQIGMGEFSEFKTKVVEPIKAQIAKGKASYDYLKNEEQISKRANDILYGTETRLTPKQTKDLLKTIDEVFKPEKPESKAISEIGRGRVQVLEAKPVKAAAKPVKPTRLESAIVISRAVEPTLRPPTPSEQRIAVSTAAMVGTVPLAVVRRKARELGTISIDESGIGYEVVAYPTGKARLMERRPSVSLVEDVNRSIGETQRERSRLRADTFLGEKGMVSTGEKTLRLGVAIGDLSASRLTEKTLAPSRVAARTTTRMRDITKGLESEKLRPGIETRITTGVSTVEATKTKQQLKQEQKEAQKLALRLRELTISVPEEKGPQLFKLDRFAEGPPKKKRKGKARGYTVQYKLRGAEEILIRLGASEAPKASKGKGKGKSKSSRGRNRLGEIGL